MALLIVVETVVDLRRDGLQVHEVAEAALGAGGHLVLLAARLTKVRHRRQLRVDRLSVEPKIGGQSGTGEG